MHWVKFKKSSLTYGASGFIMCHAKRRESEVKKVSPRTGRPKLENAKKIRMSLKLRPEEAALLQECSDRMNETRTTVIIQGIKLVKAKLDSQNGK